MIYPPVRDKIISSDAASTGHRHHADLRFDTPNDEDRKGGGAHKLSNPYQANKKLIEKHVPPLNGLKEYTEPENVHQPQQPMLQDGEVESAQRKEEAQETPTPEQAPKHTTATTTTTTTIDKPLNILVFYGDDWRHDQLGHLNPLIHSPNIDKLARDGIRFTHNCVTTSVCGVSRATYITGQYMSRHGTNRTMDLIRPWNELFPSFLKEAGYYIGHCGKDGLKPFYQDNYHFSSLYYGYHIDEVEDGDRHITQRAQDDAIEFLEQRPRDKPFYLTVAFFATHAVDEDPRQYIPMNESMALYQDTVIPIPITATDESWKRLPPFFNESNEGRIRWHWRFDEPEKHQSMMRNYYRLVTEVDTAVGNVLKTLEEQGDLNNTLVIFTTDNGVRTLAYSQAKQPFKFF